MAKKAEKERTYSRKRVGKKTSIEGFTMERELIVIAKQEAGIRARGNAIASVEGTDVSSLTELFASEGVTIEPLFGASEERLKRKAFSGAPDKETEVTDLSLYYRVNAPDERLDKLVKQLRKEAVIEAAYIKPPAELPERLNDMAPSSEDAPPASPDFTSRQAYLDAAPGGIDARYAWTQSGGSGAGVRIIDIEGAWRFTHEDLLQNQGGVAGGTVSLDLGWRNHGTAVIGEFGGDRNGFGITGICPDANVRAVSIFGGLGSARAIRQAADMLNPGDVILIELHRPGPQFNFQSRQDQRGYIAIEWWPDDFDAIRYAISRGVIVVEAAGNGSENLDDPIYNSRAPGFPINWTNPFNRINRDSGAIVVGAGAPPPGTHGRDHGPDRSRLDFSNYGALVDAQGWGREVTTCGYGDLQGGSNEDFWYTDRFSGTSSASPIVVGALGSIQGILRARGRTPLTPAQARALLRTTGSPQQDAPGRPSTQRIGNRPNLREMVNKILPQAAAVPLYRYWNHSIGDHLYTTNWSEFGSGREGWIYGGIQCYVYSGQQPGTVPLHRYWNSSIGDHFYTTDWTELENGRYGWRYEGVQCYVFPTWQSGMAALYRYWNPGIGDHFYTTNWNELMSGRHGWFYEKIQCYVLKQAATNPPSHDEATADALEVGDSTIIPETFRVGPEMEMAEGGSFMTSTPAGAISDSFKTVDSSGAFEVRRGKGQVTITINIETGNKD